MISFGKKPTWGYFKELDSERMSFKSGNDFKFSMFLLGITFLGLIILAEVRGILVDGEALILSIFVNPEHRTSAFVMILLPFLFFTLWFFAPTVRVHFDRSDRTIHYRRGHETFIFPWSQADFTHQWLPTKAGGSTLFTLIVRYPFPDAFRRWIEKKHGPVPQDLYTLNVGSFDVDSPEHGQAVFQYLDTWMNSREPSALLYDTMVKSRFGA